MWAGNMTMQLHGILLSLGICCLTLPAYADHPTYDAQHTAQVRGVFDKSPIEQPYPYLHDGSLTGPRVAESPDPLVSYRWQAPKASDPLQIYALRPIHAKSETARAFRQLASLTTGHPDVKVLGAGSIQLDFGVESPAWIEFDSPDCPGGVEMGISETNVPRSEKIGQPVKHGNTYRLELNGELYDGVRFAWIRSKACTRPWHITGVRAMCQTKPTNYLGSFSCSDPKLTRIWYSAAYGVRAALCRDYFGSILLDRGDRMSWTGDAHPAQAAALVAFANYDFIKQNLTNTSTQDNGIRSYSLYWVLSLLDYYSYTGDTSTVQSFLANACKKLDLAYQDFGKHPGLGFYGWDERLGAGFEIWFRPAIEPQNAYKMLCIRAWHEFAQAMGKLGRLDLCDRYEGYARTKMAELTRVPSWSSPFGIHAAADAVNTGLLDQATQTGLYEREFKDRVNRLSLSPFNEYFILQALGRLHKWDDALCSIRDMWGGMLDYGGTTPFEVYRHSWNRVIGSNDPVPNTQCGITSLCHPWGAGVVKWLSEEVLGVVPTAPGFTRFRVAPHLGGSLTHVAGVVPTPHGEIRFKFDQKSGQGSLSVPQGTVWTLGIPKGGRTITTLSLNGVTVWDARTKAASKSTSTHEDPDFLYLDGLLAGEHSFVASYVGTVASYQESKEVYAAKLVKRDTQTGGDWGRSYGRDGYVLCGYRADGSDQQMLPDYVQSIDFFRAFPHSGRPDPMKWSASTTDRRALASDRKNEPGRAATCLSNSDQTMTATIQVKGVHKYRIALYFVDWDGQGQQTAVETFDANTLRMIAPVAVVRGHRGGCYLVYEYDRSVKFRFDKIRGNTVTVSGLFFDPIPGH